MYSASLGVVSRRPACRHCWTAASQPARLKMKVIAGSRPAASSRSTISGRYGGASRRGRRPPRPGRLARLADLLAPRQPHQVGVDLAVVIVGEQVVEAAAGHHVLPQRHRPVLVHDDLGAAADLGEPVAEFLGVGDGGRQRHHPDRLGQVDDHLFPDRAAGPVGQVVHLVEDDVAEVLERGGARVEHVPQHLGGHHHDGRVAVDRVVTGEQADGVAVVALDQVVVLLVGQRLDRRGVEALAALLSARWTANSPTTVLPLPVGAATSTPSPPASAVQAATWNGSKSKS